MDGVVVHGEDSVVVLGLEAPQLGLVVQVVVERRGAVRLGRVVGVRVRLR